MLAYFLYCRQLLLAVVLIEFPPRLCGNTLRFYSYHLPLSTCHISDSFYLTSRTTSNLLFCHLLYCHQKSHQKSHQKKTTGYLKIIFEYHRKHQKHVQFITIYFEYNCITLLQVSIYDFRIATWIPVTSLTIFHILCCKIRTS